MAAIIKLMLILSGFSALAATDHIKTPVYCRIADKDLNVLTEDILKPASPKDSRGNPFIILKTTSTTGKMIQAKVTNVLWGFGTRDQFQIGISVDGKPYLGNNRQDLTFLFNFYVDEVRHTLICFEDIPELN